MENADDSLPLNRADGPVQPAWLYREVYALLGLPFDAVDMTQAVAAVRRAVIKRQRLFLTTPNTNFVMTALSDPAFRDSVLHSDLCIVDGMPLVWMARIFGLPIKQRVAGADLFEHLMAEPGPTLKVYFFGGPDGAAAAACRAVNLRQGAMQCVGYYSPGYGSVEEFSSQTIIDAINRSGAEIVVVALGAGKGQAWIMRNRDRLEAPVLSHLGAVVNFVAGTVARAPRWMQRTGLEWVWRIAQEPRLWSRYLKDAVLLLKVALSHLPLAFRRGQQQNFMRAGVEPPLLTDDPVSGSVKVTLQGDTVEDLAERLQAAFIEGLNRHADVEVDVCHLDRLPPRILGLLMLGQVRLAGLSLVNVSRTLQRDLRRQGLQMMF